MARRTPTKTIPKPIYAKLPVSLHIALQRLILQRWEETGRKPSQRELLVQAITRMVKKEGINLSQIEARVSSWNNEPDQVSKVTIFPNKPKRKTD